MGNLGPTLHVLYTLCDQVHSIVLATYSPLLDARPHARSLRGVRPPAATNGVVRPPTTLAPYTHTHTHTPHQVTGHLEDALALYNLMRLEPDARNLPDQYTYSALVRGLMTAQRYELVEQVRGHVQGRP